MMHVFVNALAASAGAGLTYVRNVLPQLSSRENVVATVALHPGLQAEFAHLPRVSFVSTAHSLGAGHRFWQEQTVLPGMIKRSGADVLISTGNLALRSSPVPQILLSGNSLYTSRDFFCDLRQRGDYRAWIDTRLKGFFARRSLAWADVTVAPSQAFADDLELWTGKKAVAIHHGFDPEVFFGDPSPLPKQITAKLDAASSDVRLLFVSHYNYYRNFETLLRSLPLLKSKLGPRKVKLFLTCSFGQNENPGSYDPAEAAQLIQTLGIQNDVELLGPVAYRSLHHLYRACQIYVTPAYAETFAHPLVEAMASRLPVVASDLPVHREVCREAAIYFDRWSPEKMAEAIVSVANSSVLADRLAAHAITRSHDFSWDAHTTKLLHLAEDLLTRQSQNQSRRMEST